MCVCVCVCVYIYIYIYIGRNVSNTNIYVFFFLDGPTANDSLGGGTRARACHSTTSRGLSRSSLFLIHYRCPPSLMAHTSLPFLPPPPEFSSLTHSLISSSSNMATHLHFYFLVRIPCILPYSTYSHSHSHSPISDI